jgi:hypothetical protein
MPCDGLTTILTVEDAELVVADEAVPEVVGREPEREADKLPLFIAWRSGKYLLVEAELTTNSPSESLAIMLSVRGPPGPLT